MKKQLSTLRKIYKPGTLFQFCGNIGLDVAGIGVLLKDSQIYWTKLKQIGYGWTQETISNSLYIKSIKMVFEPKKRIK